MSLESEFWRGSVPFLVVVVYRRVSMIAELLFVEVCIFNVEQNFRKAPLSRS